ncbi:flagellin N-terminal helical domain-containing protein [Selenomonas ruminantium]|uniref:Flagellin n=1 Tax=Selenomonas ruminantium TaxID=971 RepID=A0A1H0PYG4_SELRU|nr:flagellin [Selenomonas ruminantium]SDP09469.1 flagellin [Selenomonas ruminantium]
MSMVVKNNISAIRTLGTLNKNSAALAKSLQQVSSGMKINSAADDNSGYAIAERMQVRIRSLDQADQNTQNGANLLKVAEGSVSSTIDILRTMKEKAINAANDTNTDTDRGIIQKEMDQFIDQVDDNALITYNGKTLVDGSKMPKGNATRTSLTNQSLDKSTTGLTALVDLKNRNGESLNILTSDRITVSYVIQGQNYSKEIEIDATKTLNDVLVEAMDPYIDVSNNPQLRAANEAYNSAVSTANANYAAAESTANTNFNNAVNAATATYNQNVYDPVHSYSNKTTTYTNITLSEAISLAAADVELNTQTYSTQNRILTEHPSTDNTYWSNMQTTFGLTYASYSSMAADTSTALASTQAVYTTYSNQLSTLISEQTEIKESAISTAASTRDSAIASALAIKVAEISSAVETYQGNIGELIPYQLTMDHGYIVGQDAAGNDVYTADMGSGLTIRAAGTGNKYQLAGFTFNVTDVNGQIKKNVNAVLDNFTESIRAFDESSDRSLTFQVDAKANQAIKIGLTDMRSEALGLKGADGTTISLATQKSANVAVNVLDNAIKKALDQQTDIGAIANRLNQTSANLHIARDNVQASESTIRDADMAKAMTEYTKNNVLLQASQSMLAQANQSSSSVLGLLQ